MSYLRNDYKYGPNSLITLVLKQSNYLLGSYHIYSSPWIKMSFDTSLMEIWLSLKGQRFIQGNISKGSTRACAEFHPRPCSLYFLFQVPRYRPWGTGRLSSTSDVHLESLRTTYVLHSPTMTVWTNLPESCGIGQLRRFQNLIWVISPFNFPENQSVQKSHILPTIVVDHAILLFYNGTYINGKTVGTLISFAML